MADGSIESLIFLAFTAAVTAVVAVLVTMAVMRRSAARASPMPGGGLPASTVQTLIDAIPAMVNCKDRDGRYVLMNAYQAELYGTTTDQAIGKSAADLLGANYGAHTGQLDREVVETGRAIGPIEEHYAVASGEARHWLTSKTPLRSADGSVSHVVTVAFDITDRKRAESLLIQARNESEAASRAKATFLATMSHELRTPLNAIIGFSEMIKAEIHGAVGSSKYTEYAGNVVDSGRFLLSIINDILDLSKIDAGQVVLNEVCIPLRGLFEQCRSLIEPRARQDGVTVAIGDDLPAVDIRGDRRLLMQCVLNVLTNAVKFSPRDGAVSVGAGLSDDGSLAIRIADHGCGMTEEEIQIALRPFEQIDRDHARRHEGSGLGLPIVEGLVKLHGGALAIESEPGVGTVVTLRLPADRVLTLDGQPQLHLAASD